MKASLEPFIHRSLDDSPYEFSRIVEDRQIKSLTMESRGVSVRMRQRRLDRKEFGATAQRAEIERPQETITSNSGDSTSAW